MAEDWPADPHRRDELVADRRRDRQANPTVTGCGCCGDARGPWLAVDPITAWILCPNCLADLRRFSLAVERHGRGDVLA